MLTHTKRGRHRQADRQTDGQTEMETQSAKDSKREVVGAKYFCFALQVNLNDVLFEVKGT